jgi:hypothetical protein
VKRTFELPVEVGPGRAPRALGIVFASQRGSMSFKGLASGGRAPRGKVAFLSRRFMEIRWEADDAPLAGTRVTVELDYAGEKPLVLAVEQKDDPAAELRREDPKEALFAWRRAREKNPHKKHKQLFNRLDEALWPDDHDEHDELRQLLEDCLWRRKDGLDPYAGVQLGAGLLATLRAVSAEFMAAFEAYRSPKTGRLAYASIEDAFDRFARAELSLLEPGDVDAAGPLAQAEKAKACQPDSTYFFLFAELAALCIHEGVQRDVWERLLPTLVYALNQFHETYRVTHPGEPVIGRLPPPSVKHSELRAQRARFKKEVPAMGLESIWTNYLREFLD